MFLIKTNVLLQIRRIFGVKETKANLEILPKLDRKLHPCLQFDLVYLDLLYASFALT